MCHQQHPGNPPLLCPITFHVVVMWSFNTFHSFSKCSPVIYPFVLVLLSPQHLIASFLTENRENLILTDLPIHSLVKQIQVFQRNQDQQLRTSQIYWRAHLQSCPAWCPDERSETSWAWRAVRRPPVTLCSTSASTSPLEIWMKLSSPLSSSRGKTSKCAC